MSIVTESTYASVMAMLKIFIVFAISFGSAHAGFLSNTFIPLISNFSFNVLTPCLSFSNLVKQLSLDSLGLFWPILVWAAISIILSYGVGFAVCALIRPRHEFKSTIVSAIAFSNPVSMPIVIFDSLTTSSLFDASTSPLERATAMCFIYSISWNFIMYIIGYPYLLNLSPEQHEPISQQAIQQATVAASGGRSSSDDTLVHSPSVVVALVDEHNNIVQTINATHPSRNISTVSSHSSYNGSSSPAIDQNSTTVELSSMSLPHTPSSLGQETLETMTNTAINRDITHNIPLGSNNQHNGNSSDDLVDIDDDPRYPEARCITYTRYLFHGLDFIWNKITGCIGSLASRVCNIRVRFALQQMLTNPGTVTQIVSLFVGLIYPLKQLLFNDLKFFFNAVEFIGKSAIPLGTLVTAANAYYSIDRNFGRESRILRREVDIALEQQNQSLDSLDSLDNDNDNNNNNNDTYAITCNTTATAANRPTGDSTNNSIMSPTSMKKSVRFSAEPPESAISPRVDEQHDPMNPFTIASIPEGVFGLDEDEDDNNSTSMDISSYDNDYTSTPQSTATYPGNGYNNTTNNSLNLDGPATTANTPIQYHHHHHHHHHDLPSPQHTPPLHAYATLHPTLPPLDTDATVDNISHGTIHTISSVNNKTSDKNGNTYQEFASSDDYDDSNPSSSSTVQQRRHTHHNNSKTLPTSTSMILKNPSLRYTPSTFRATVVAAAAPPVKKQSLIEYDTDGSILPLPRLSWAEMLIISICRLVISPALIFGLMAVCEYMQWYALLPQDLLTRLVIILCSLSTTAESVLVIVTKAYRVRESMMLSLIYVVEYVMCFFTIPVGLVLSIIYFIPAETP